MDNVRETKFLNKIYKSNYVSPIEYKHVNQQRKQFWCFSEDFEED